MVGDKVWLREEAARAGAKILASWMGPYTIVRIKGDRQQVLEVDKEGSDGSETTDIHMNQTKLYIPGSVD